MTQSSSMDPLGAADFKESTGALRAVRPAVMLPKQHNDFTSSREIIQCAVRRYSSMTATPSGNEGASDAGTEEIT